MTDQERKAMEMALEALENAPIEYDFHGNPMDAEFGKQSTLAIEALRQALSQDHGFDRTASHMAGEYVDTNWDTSDMAYRPNGLSVEQEPVAWMYPSDLKAFETDEATATAFSIKVGCPDEVSVPLYTAPPSKPWVSLTKDDVDLLITLHAPPLNSSAHKHQSYSPSPQSAKHLNTDIVPDGVTEMLPKKINKA